METFWCVERYCGHSSYIEDVFDNKKAAKDYAAFKRAKNRLECFDKFEKEKVVVSKLEIKSDFLLSLDECIPKQIRVVIDGRSNHRYLIEPKDNALFKNKVWIKIAFLAGSGWNNIYGFDVCLKYIPSFYQVDYLNKGQKKAVKLFNKHRDCLLEAVKLSPFALMQKGFKAVINHDGWMELEQQLRKRLGADYDAKVHLMTPFDIEFAGGHGELLTSGESRILSYIQHEYIGPVFYKDI